MPRGGSRPGAGRKPGQKIKPATVVFYKRVTPEEYKLLSTFLENIRQCELPLAKAESLLFTI